MYAHLTALTVTQIGHVPRKAFLHDLSISSMNEVRCPSSAVKPSHRLTRSATVPRVSTPWEPSSLKSNIGRNTRGLQCSNADFQRLEASHNLSSNCRRVFGPHMVSSCTCSSLHTNYLVELLELLLELDVSRRAMTSPLASPARASWASRGPLRCHPRGCGCQEPAQPQPPQQACCL
jgi:hypothetical protein